MTVAINMSLSKLTRTASELGSEPGQDVPSSKMSFTELYWNAHASHPDQAQISEIPQTDLAEAAAPHTEAELDITAMDTAPVDPEQASTELTHPLPDLSTAATPSISATPSLPNNGGVLPPSSSIEVSTTGVTNTDAPVAAQPPSPAGNPETHPEISAPATGDESTRANPQVNAHSGVDIERPSPLHDAAPQITSAEASQQTLPAQQANTAQSTNAPETGQIYNEDSAAVAGSSTTATPAAITPATDAALSVQSDTIAPESAKPDPALTSETNKVEPRTTAPVLEQLGTSIAAAPEMASLTADPKASNIAKDPAQTVTNGAAAPDGKAEPTADLVAPAVRADSAVETPQKIEVPIEAPSKNTLPQVDNSAHHIARNFSASPVEPLAALTADPSAPLFSAAAAPLDTAAKAMAIQTTPTLPLPATNNPQAVQAVADNLVRAFATQSGISIRLDPPEMGNVQISFQFDTERGVTAVIRSELPETAALLKERADILHQTLKDSGFDSVTLSFEQGSQSQQDQNFAKQSYKETIFSVEDAPAMETLQPSQPRHYASRLSGNQPVDMKL